MVLKKSKDEIAALKLAEKVSYFYCMHLLTHHVTYVFSVGCECSKKTWNSRRAKMKLQL